MQQDPRNMELRKNIQAYNAVFTFTSTWVHSIGFELGPGLHTYRVQGSYYHMIGGMEPEDGQVPHFLQAYVYNKENEMQNRRLQSPNLSEENLCMIREIMGRINPHVHVFERAADHLAANPLEELCVVLTTKRNYANEEHS